MPLLWLVITIILQLFKGKFYESSRALSNLECYGSKLFNYYDVHLCTTPCSAAYLTTCVFSLVEHLIITTFCCLQKGFSQADSREHIFIVCGIASY